MLHRRSLITLVLPLLLSCSGGSGDSDDNDNAKTYTVQIAVNLPFNTATLDTNAFNYLQATTYTNSTAVNFTDTQCTTKNLALYFLKVAPLTWDLYLFVQQTPINVQNGSIGSFGHYKATLQFNNHGQLIATEPATVVTADVSDHSASALQIKLDFGAEGDTTAYASNFAVNRLTSFNACVP